MAWQGYSVISKLGEGGMATVYKAIQQSLQRPVAIKILSHSLIDQPEVQARFEKESLIIAQLNHPHIIHVIDRGITPKGRPFFVMEYVDGMTLEEAINRGKLDFSRKLEVLVQVCKALSYAHKQGVIHRDIKPANVLLDSEDQARVLDFGIAHFYRPNEARAALVTDAGDIMGTSAYMAPEMLERADAASVQSDLYAFGVLMYELFTGVQPQGDIPSPREFEPDLPATLERLILHCLSPDPVLRPDSADDVRSQLLMLSRGGHLSSDQKGRASRGKGKLDGNFELLDVLHEDQRYSVYLYEDAANARLLAVKVMPPDFPGLREAKLLARLPHPYILPVLGVQEDGRQISLITEYLSHGTLSERLLEAQAPEQAIQWMIQIAEALAFAHRNRVVHGNLRPHCLLLTDDGQIRMTDFGTRPPREQDELVESYRHPALKDEAGDLFALGVIFYQALTGKVPQFRSGRAVRTRAFAELAVNIQAVALRLLETDSAQRFANAEAALVALNQLLQPARAKPVKAPDLTLLPKQDAPSNGPKRPFPWYPALVTLLALGLGVQEYYLGYGQQYVWPHVAPWIESVSEKVQGSAILEWSEKP